MDLSFVCDQSVTGNQAIQGGIAPKRWRIFAVPSGIYERDRRRATEDRLFFDISLTIGRRRPS